MDFIRRYAIYVVIGVMPAAVIGYSALDIEWWLFCLPYWYSMYIYKVD